MMAKPLAAKNPPLTPDPPKLQQQTTVVAREPLRIYIVEASTFGLWAAQFRNQAASFDSARCEKCALRDDPCLLVVLGNLELHAD